MSFKIADAYVEVEPRVDRGFQADAEKVASDSGRSFGDGFVRDSTGRLRDGRGRFVKEFHNIGDEGGKELSKGFAGLTGIFSKLGGSIGSAGTSVGQLTSKVQFLGASGPAAILLIIEALLALPFAASLASTAIVLGLGGALAGLGLFSTFGVKSVQKDLGGLVKHVKSVMRDISKPFIDTWHTIADVARQTFDAFTPALKSAFKEIAPAVSDFARNFGTAFQQLIPAIEPLSRAFSALLRALGPQLVPLFQQISDGLISIANAVSANPEALAGMITDLMKIIPVTLQVIAVLTRMGEWMQTHGGIWNWLTGGAPETIRLLATVGRVIGSATGAVVKFAVSVGTTLKNAFNTVVGTISGFVQSVITFLTPAFTLIANVFRTGWNLLVTIAQTVWNVIHAIIFGNITQVHQAIANGLAKISLAWSAAWNAVRTLVTTAWAGIKSIVSTSINFVRSTISAGMNAARSVVSTIINAIKSLFTSGMSSAKSTVSSAISSIKSTISSGASSVVSTMKGVPGRIRNALGNLGSLLYGAGQAIMRGLINGIRSMISSAIATIRNAVSSIRSYLPFSPAKVGPFSGRGWTLYSGQSIMTGFAEGITGSTPTVTGALAGAMSAAKGAIPASLASPALSGAVAAVSPVASGAGSAPVTGTVIKELHINVNGTFDLADPAQRKAIAEQLASEIQDALRKNEKRYR